MNHELACMLGAAHRLDAARASDPVLPLQDFQLIFPAVFGDQEPVGPYFLTSADSAKMDYEAEHALPPAAGPFWAEDSLPEICPAIFLRTGTATNPCPSTKVKVKKNEQSSQSQKYSRRGKALCFSHGRRARPRRLFHVKQLAPAHAAEQVQTILICTFMEHGVPGKS